MVTIFQKIRQLVAGPKAAPKAAVSGGSAPDYFRKSTRDKATLARNKTIYESGGLVTAALRAPGRTVLANGWRLEGDASGAKLVQATIDGFDFETTMASLITDARVLGNGIAEIVPLRGGGIAVQLRDAARFKIQQDGYGNTDGYLFVDEDEWDDSRGVLLAPDDVIDIVLDPIPNSPYGRSLVSTAIDEILRDAKTNEGLAKAIERHGFPKMHARVGQPGEVISKEDLRDIEKELRDLSSKNDFVTCFDVLLGNIDTAGITGAAEFDNIMLSRLLAAIGVPPEEIGLDYKGSTEATANVRFKAWYDSIGALQRQIAPVISRQLFDRITGRPGSVWLVFNDPSPTDDMAKATYITQVIAAISACGRRPSAEWVAEQFDIDPAMLEEKPEPVNPFGQPPRQDEQNTETPPDEEPPEEPPRGLAAPPTIEKVTDTTDADLQTIAQETYREILKAVGGIE